MTVGRISYRYVLRSHCNEPIEGRELAGAERSRPAIRTSGVCGTLQGMRIRGVYTVGKPETLKGSRDDARGRGRLKCREVQKHLR
jgi:hypothetical protein